MPDTPPSNRPRDDREEPDPVAIIGSYPTARRAHEAGLAILAAGHHYWIQREDGRFLLAVPRPHAAKLRREVEISENRNRYWPPPPLELSTRSANKLPAALACAALVAAFALQSAFPELVERGAVNSDAILARGEYWRLLTAITLHADLGHLAGNLMGIALFGYLASRYLGSGLAWLLTLLAAAASNLTNALLNAGQDYTSLGASTAVFAALGLIAGYPLGAFLRSRQPIQPRDWLLPFFGACILFAWMGGGDFPTDVPAHLWSFAYGSAASASVAAVALHAKLGPLWQRGALAIAAASPALAWIAALAHARG